MLFPLLLQFNSSEIALLEENRESLEQTGFIFSEFQKDAVEISGIPTLISESEVAILLEQLLSDLENEVPESGYSQIDILSKSLATGMAVKSGTVLSYPEQQNMVNSLFACKESTLSPFNRPVFITLTVDELDKKFM